MPVCYTCKCIYIGILIIFLQSLENEKTDFNQVIQFINPCKPNILINKVVLKFYQKKKKTLGVFCILEINMFTLQPFHFYIKL